jgi:hypothetical protein
MPAIVIAMAIGIVAILLGVKGFTPEGIPFTKKTHIKGTAGIIVGIVCLLLGILFLIGGALPLLRQR